MVEAGGIEPPSRCISAWVSTCVVGLFDGSELLADQPTGHPRAEPGCFSSARRRAVGRPRPPHVRTSLRSTSGSASRRRGPTGCLVRQPNGSHHWHVIGVPGVLRGLLTTSTRHPDLNLPGRSQSPPVLHPSAFKEHRIERSNRQRPRVPSSEYRPDPRDEKPETRNSRSGRIGNGWPAVIRLGPVDRGRCRSRDGAIHSSR